MAKQPSKQIRVYLDQYNLSGDLTSTSKDITQETPVVTSISDAGPRRLVGNYDHTDKLLGFFDGVDEGIDERIFALLGDNSDHLLGVAYEAAAENTILYEALAKLMGQPRSGAVGGAVLLNFDMAGSGGLSRSLVLGSKTSTAAENLTGRNMGATTAGQVFQAVFRVLAFTGTNITLRLQESQDNGGADPYADIAGLTSGALTGIGAVRATTTAATEAWKRCVLSGTYTSALILVTAGLVAGT